MRREYAFYQIQTYEGENEKRSRVKQLARKCLNLLSTLPSLLDHQHEYAVCNKSASHLDPNEVRLLNVRKLNNKLSPLEILLMNFCHTTDDIKRLQKQPERLDFLKLKPKEIEAILMELLFVFQKRRCIELAVMQVKKRKKVNSLVR